MAILIALSAGFTDGFTFFHYAGRFAGAQTGNIIQAGISLAEGKIWNSLDFFIPIGFFILGAMFRVFYAAYLTKHHHFVTLYMLVIELIGLTAFVCLYATVWKIPASYSVGILSFFMAIQFDTFNHVHGMAYTSVFTTGNIKVFSVNLAQWMLGRKKENLRAVKILGSIIPAFLIGAFFATLLGKLMGDWTLIVTCILLFIVFIIYRVDGYED